jgi:hypothetical protein
MQQATSSTHAQCARNKTLPPEGTTSFAQSSAAATMVGNSFIARRRRPPVNVKPFQLTRSNKVAAKYSMAARLFKNKTPSGMMAASPNLMKFATGLGRGHDPSAQKHHHRKKSSNFIGDLCHLLRDSSNDRVIYWLPDGKAFKILKPLQFSQTILPAYASLKPSYTSFRRMLDQHRFLQRISIGPDKGAFSHHPLFLRDNHSLFKNKTANQLKKASSVTFIKVITPGKDEEETQQEDTKKTKTPHCVPCDDDTPPEQSGCMMMLQPIEWPKRFFRNVPVLSSPLIATPCSL